MNKDQLLTLVREYLAANGYDAIIIPTQDPHFGEYTQEYFKVREWLSGFTGSAGTLVVSTKGAALWTDSRYFTQATAQLQGSGIRLMKMKMAGTPTISQWLKQQYREGATVVLDGSLFSIKEFDSLSKELAPDSTLISVADPFVSIWKGRAPLEFNKIETLPLSCCGESPLEKLERVKSALNLEEGMRFVYYLATCDDIAWLCNIRGRDIEYNPLALSYMLLTENALHLFVNIESLSEASVSHLAQGGVELHPYNQFHQVIGQISPDMVRIYNPSAISAADYKIFVPEGATCKEDLIPGGVVADLKSVKNGVEIEGFRKSHIADAVAWCRLLKRLDEALKNGETLTEYAVAQMFPAIRRANEAYAGESFEPIVAFGPNAALPHYAATESSTSVIGENGFVLMDTGAHYTYGGTTDTTRTIPVGELTQEQKKFYTLVLKGMIDLTLAKFPEGTRGSQLDILARGHLYKEAVMYYHGTGHGIGHYLCVHEGPQSIRIEENPVTLKRGMFISNEPAIYFEGEYGIRIENVIMAEFWKASKFNNFYKFDTFTLVPIATSPIIKEMLTGEEIEWLNSYHSLVYEKISPLLGEEERVWLKNATSSI